MADWCLLGQVRRYLRQHCHSRWWPGIHRHFRHVNPRPPRHDLRAPWLQDRLQHTRRPQRSPRRVRTNQCLSIFQQESNTTPALPGVPVPSPAVTALVNPLPRSSCSPPSRVRPSGTLSPSPTSRDCMAAPRVREQVTRRQSEAALQSQSPARRNRHKRAAAPSRHSSKNNRRRRNLNTEKNTTSLGLAACRSNAQFLNLVSLLALVLFQDTHLSHCTLSIYEIKLRSNVADVLIVILIEVIKASNITYSWLRASYHAYGGLDGCC